jgi:ATP-dependent DNA helicase RecQ
LRYEQKRAQDRARLAAMLRYAQSSLCRTRLLVTYFGYTDAPPCGACDNCQRAAKAMADAQGVSVPRVSQTAANRPVENETKRALIEEALRRQARGNRGRALKIERARRGAVGIGLGKGDLVRHAIWGDGEVVRVVGDTAYAFFPGHGEKLLKASFLEKISP